MVYIPIDPKEKKTLLNAIRATIEKNGGRAVTMKKFIESSGVNRHSITRHYATWNDGLRAAGFNFEPYKARLEAPQLLPDWAAVVRKLRRIPSAREYEIHGKHTPSTFHQRFGSWTKVPAVFRKFAGRSPKWKDVLPLLPAPDTAGRVWGGSRRIVQPRERVPRRLKRGCPKGTPLPRSSGRPFNGPLIEAGGMRYAPLNEIGVVFLFGVLAESLGFHVETLQIAFPDCEARRDMVNGVSQGVKIEFEYESRNFRDHGHPPEGCDIIVCWHHNWEDCPKNIEVIALDEKIKLLGPLVPA